jgi:hypothetical protein
MVAKYLFHPLDVYVTGRSHNAKYERLGSHLVTEYEMMEDIDNGILRPL